MTAAPAVDDVGDDWITFMGSPGINNAFTDGKTRAKREMDRTSGRISAADAGIEIAPQKVHTFQGWREWGETDAAKVGNERGTTD